LAGADVDAMDWRPVILAITGRSYSSGISLRERIVITNGLVWDVQANR